MREAAGRPVRRQLGIDQKRWPTLARLAGALDREARGSRETPSLGRAAGTLLPEIGRQGAERGAWPCQI